MSPHQGASGRRRSTRLAASIVLGAVALVIAITAYVTGVPKLFVVAVVLGLVAVLLATLGRSPLN